MSGEATTELTQVGSVDLNEILHPQAPSTDEAGKPADERSDETETPESDQREGANDDVSQQYETRLRGLQAAKDREIAAARKEAAELRQVTETYEKTMLDIAVRETYAQALNAGYNQQQATAAAQAVQQQYDLQRQQQRLQQVQGQMQQHWNAQQSDAAQLLAWRLASDPKFSGVESDELMKWAKFGPEAMVQAAENLALGARAKKSQSRKSNRADDMGGGSGGSADVTSTMSGADLIQHALKNTRRSSDRWS